MVAVIIGRELAVTVLRSLAYNRGLVIAASPLGKIKMAAQVVAILLLILGREQLQQFAVLGEVALWVVVVTALASGWDYYRDFIRSAGSKTADFSAARANRRRGALADLPSDRHEVVGRDRISRVDHPHR